MDNNLPDDCQGNNPNLPWNEPEQLDYFTCEECGMNLDWGDKVDEATNLCIPCSREINNEL